MKICQVIQDLKAGGAGGGAFTKPNVQRNNRISLPFLLFFRTASTLEIYRVGKNSDNWVVKLQNFGVICIRMWLGLMLV